MSKDRKTLEFARLLLEQIRSEADRFNPNWLRQLGLEMPAFSLTTEMKEMYEKAQYLVSTPGMEALFAHTIQEAATRAVKATRGPILTSNGSDISGDQLAIQARASLIERASLDLCILAASAIMAGNISHAKAVGIALERLASPQSGVVLERYPALLMLYTAGVCAVISKNGAALAELLLEREFITHIGMHAIATNFDVDDVIKGFSEVLPPNMNPEQAGPLPWHDHMREWVHPILKLVTNSDEYLIERSINTFEFLRLLVQFDLEVMPNIKPGSFVYRDHCGRDTLFFLYETKSQGAQTWVKSLFGHSLERFTAALRAFDRANERGLLNLDVLPRTELTPSLANIFVS